MNSALRCAIFTALFAFVLTSQPNFSLAGFGVSPPGIIEDRLIKGSHLERTIYLVQGDPKEDVNIGIDIESDKIKNWIHFENGNEFVIPKGIQQFPLNVIIDVPQDAELGIYKAFIRISTKPKPIEGGGNVSIALGGRIDVDLTVGEGIFSDFNVRRIDILNIKEGESLKASITIENLGNVPVKPDRVSFELFNKYGDLRLAYGETIDLKEVASFKTESFIVEFPIDIKLGIGEYWAVVKVYKNGAVTKEMKTVFNVNPNPKSITNIFNALKGKELVGIIVGAVILIVIIGLIWISRKRKKE